ncbi:MAG: hypothetical protein JW983_04405 [Elusimicrobia bacterium]|nr:hypothetical protein [Elusimicrobiota bacterium]
MKNFRQLSLIKKIWIIVAGFVIILVILELIARLIFPPGYHPFGMPIIPEPSSGNNLIKLIKIVQNHPSHTTFRIVVTGGSAAFGLGASSIENSFPAQLGKYLCNRFPDKKIEVLNGAVESFDSSSEILLYLRFLHKLKPDMILMFSGFNDMGKAVLSQLSSRPYKEVEKLKKIRYVNSLDTSKIAKLLVYSISMKIHGTMLHISRIYEIFTNFFGNLNPDEIEVMKETVDYRFKGAVTEINTFLDVVHTFHSISQEHGMKFLLVVQPIRMCGTKIQKIPRMSWSDRAVRNLYFRHFKPSLQSLAKKDNFAMLDLNSEFTDYLIQNDGFIDSCHLNDKGYSLSAKRVAQFIQRKPKLLSR